MAHFFAPRHSIRSVDEATQREIIEAYVDNPQLKAVGERFDLDGTQVRRILQSPQGSFMLEQRLRETARQRAVKLAALSDKLLAEVELAIVRGNERVLPLNSRDSDSGGPRTIFIRPEL